MRKAIFVCATVLFALLPVLGQVPDTGVLISVDESTATLAPYTPAGWEAYVGPRQTGFISYPHYFPFHVVMSEIDGRSNATCFIAAAENDCWLSFSGQNGDGSHESGSVYMNPGTGTPQFLCHVVGNQGGVSYLRASKNCRHTNPPTQNQPQHYLMIDNSQSDEGVYVTLIR